MPIIDFPICGYYDKQRFVQFNPSDTANWYMVETPQGKKKIAMYPAMGRRHINFLGRNVLIFPIEPRGEFKSINYAYYVVSGSIYRVDKFYNQVEITGGQLTTFGGDVYFTYLVAGLITFAIFVDGQNVYVYNENTGAFSVVTDPNAPGGATTGGQPKYVATFGNRIVVSQFNSSFFYLSAINLGGDAYDPATAFTIAGESVFAQESGIIRQFAVLHNTLYILTDYTTGIWSNNPSVFVSTGGVTTTFPWRKSTTYDWDFGILNSNSLDVDFGMMTWQAQNRNGLIQIMASNGQTPKRISTRAIDVLFNPSIRQGIIGSPSPFIQFNANGFLYEWENTIFYRISAGQYQGYGILDNEINANAIEYNFETETWHRVIELNGERNRIQRHIFYNNTHLVTVQGEGTVYEMSGQFYDNEIINPLESDNQEIDAYIREPFRYERVTPIIAEEDYAEFETTWVQIDFVWGESFNIFSETPFANAEFIIDEQPGADGTPQYLIAEGLINGNPQYLISETGNIPEIDELTYNQIYKPHLELYFSDDGGVSFYPADVREFSQLGYYSWRMRWYQLGPSRNRSYLLVCVSSSPIVVLGGIMEVRRISGGAS